MIFLDANVFLRYLSRARTPNDIAMQAQARAFVRLVQSGRETFTTSDAVIAEVVYILHHPRHYGSSRAAVAAGLKPLLTLGGCRMPRKRCVIDALDRWAATPAISFVDALGIAHSQELKVPLGTFDAAVGRLPGVTLWQPPSPSATSGTTGTT